MITKKKIIGTLSKCYSLAPLYYKGEQHFLVAAEQQERCLLFDRDGTLVDTIWEGPGGVMAMQQIPGTDGVFLAIQQFYSPDDSKLAKIVLVIPDGNGNWEVQILTELPHVHRIDIQECNGVQYLLACTLKSGHESKNDWSMPGKVYVAELPKEIDHLRERGALELVVIKDGLLKNHGYTRALIDQKPAAIISCESGVYQFILPEKKGGMWNIEKLISSPASDAVLVDLNDDGICEMAVISPFHGDKISIYEKGEQGYQEAYKYIVSAPFSHAIFGGEFGGKNCVIIGHREGERHLIYFSWSQKSGYHYEFMDQGAGAANIMKLPNRGDGDILISANRESDEIAMYLWGQEEHLVE